MRYEYFLVENDCENEILKEMEEMSKVEKEIIEGYSGVRHEVDIIHLGGKKYILLDCRGMCEDEVKLELIKKAVISCDTNLPLLLLIRENSSLLEDIKYIPKTIEVKVIKCD